MINIYILYDLDIHMDYYYFNIFIAMIHAQFKNIKKKENKKIRYLDHLLEILMLEKNLPRFCQKKTIVVIRHSNHHS